MIKKREKGRVRRVSLNREAREDGRKGIKKKPSSFGLVGATQALLRVANLCNHPTWHVSLKLVCIWYMARVQYSIQADYTYDLYDLEAYLSSSLNTSPYPLFLSLTSFERSCSIRAWAFSILSNLSRHSSSLTGAFASLRSSTTSEAFPILIPRTLLGPPVPSSFRDGDLDRPDL